MFMSELDRQPGILNSHPYLRQTLDLISDKWTVAVIYVLSQGTKRYGELQREIGGVSQRMLTRTLRDLEQNGLVQREVYPMVPPMVEYSLTPLGETLVEPLKTLCTWAKAHFHEVEATRARNDGEINE
jgi:DNA-binding HxlR family transcriptional regulator